MGICIQNGYIKKIWDNESNEINYKDQLTFLLAKLAHEFPNLKFKVAMSGWFEDGKVNSLNYYIFAADHPVWFSVSNSISMENAYLEIMKKLEIYKIAETYNINEEKYEGGLF